MGAVRSFFILIGVFLFSSVLNACPCGCGAVGPLILSPGEAWKFKLGFSKDYNRKLIDTNGRPGFDDGPRHTDKYSFGLAKSVDERLSLSGQWNYERNYHPDAKDHYSFGDPSVGLRYTFFSTGAFDHLLPTLQAHLSYKHATAKGLLENSEQPHSLDIHGNSYSEILPGLDAWFTHLNWTMGLGVAGIFRRPIKVKDEQSTQTREKGAAIKSQFSLSYTYFGTGQVLASLEREEKGQDKVDRRGVANSGSLRHTLDLTTNIRVGMMKTLALSLQRSGYYLETRNTSRKEAFSVSYLQAI
ncbi:MAG: hypothetical protein HRU09_05960 [Oligoflexales bacterium]|nr:hypothetical protein [Oligoflexales bacterium]